MNAWQKGFVGSLIVLALAWQYGFNGDQRITDSHENWRVAAFRHEPFPQQIVVVALDDLSLAKLKSFAGHIPRRRYAELLGKLGQAQAVGIDVVLDEQDPADPEGDREFAAAVQRHGRVVLPMFAWQGAHPLDQATLKETAALTRNLPPGQPDFAGSLSTINPHSLQPPYAPLRENAAALGYADINAEADNVYRRPILVRQTMDTGSLLPHFSLAVACLATRTPLVDAVSGLPNELRFAGHSAVPLAQNASLYLRPIARRGGDFRDRPGAPVPTISFYDALRASPDTFKDKIVLVGVTAAAAADIRATPIDNGLRGVELNAEILANLLYVTPNRPLGLPLQWALILLAVVLPLYLYATQPPPRATIFASLTFIALVSAMEAAYWTLQQVPSWSSVLLGFGAATMITGLQRLREEAAQRQALRHRFASYVAPEMVNRLARDPAHADVRARRVRAAILFSDVRGFTAYVERHPPEIVRRQMEEYLAEMTESVHAQRGVVDKFIGDGLMALFGPFYEDEGHEAAKALACALNMRERLDALNERWRGEGLPPFHIGIGIQVGDVLFGEFGSPERYTLTALGDDVNLASRLESATKEFQATILTTNAVRQETEDLLGHLVRFEDEGMHILRGRTQPTHIYRVLRPGEASASIVLSPGSSTNETPATAGPAAVTPPTTTNA
jgi:adenylate cyclase